MSTICSWDLIPTVKAISSGTTSKSLIWKRTRKCSLVYAISPKLSLCTALARNPLCFQEWIIRNTIKGGFNRETVWNIKWGIWNIAIYWNRNTRTRSSTARWVSNTPLKMKMMKSILHIVFPTLTLGCWTSSNQSEIERMWVKSCRKADYALVWEDWMFLFSLSLTSMNSNHQFRSAIDRWF